VANNIYDATEIRDELKTGAGGSCKIHIRSLIKGTDEECEKLKKPMKKGHVLIGTMLLTRGVDMEFDKKVSRMHSLFYIIFLSFDHNNHIFY
jgi:hypothetical protein